MSSNKRDLIQISLGPSANAVSAHALNLQGLAVTDADGACDAPTTHRLERNRWVPRCLLVDEPTRFFVSSEISNAMQLSQAPNATLSSSIFQAVGSSFSIQPLDSALQLQRAQPSEWSQNYQTLSSSLAYSTYSRYYQEPAATELNTYTASSENARHVNWDDLGDEKDEDEDRHEDEAQKHTRLLNERLKWERDTMVPVQSLLDQAVNKSSEAVLSPLTWMDYWMPPYSEQSKVALQYSTQSHMTPHWDAYRTDALLSDDWMEDVLLDRVRCFLEESDSCQGVLITTEGHGMYAGLTTALLHEFQQEAKSAGRIVFHITNPQEDYSIAQPDNVETENELPWQPAHIKRVRQHLSSGLAMHDFTQNAHVVVPLALPANVDSLFRASAQLAVALEACTLPIRLKASSPRRVGLTNAPFLGEGGDYDAQWGSTAQCLSVSEYIQCMQPSGQYKLLELDSLCADDQINNEQLWNALLPGTSLERDARMRDDGHSRFGPQDVAPGRWMQTSKYGGLLSTLSPRSSTNPRYEDRSLHRHFALSTAARPVLLHGSLSDPRYQYDPSAVTLPHYQTAIIQGMGIAHRPERSIATVLNQTLGQLTFGSATSGGAGAYWKSLLGHLDQPTLAVLGNTTRIYSHIQQVASDMKLVLGQRYRGFHQRDVANGVLPEVDDCSDALEGCLEIQDVYRPPDGSGLALDDFDGDND